MSHISFLFGLQIKKWQPVLNWTTKNSSGCLKQFDCVGWHFVKSPLDRRLDISGTFWSHSDKLIIPSEPHPATVDAIQMVLASLLKMHNTYFCIYAGGRSGATAI